METKIYMLRKLKKEEPSWVEEYMEDPEKAIEEMEKEAPTFGESLPILSVGSEEKQKDVAFVKFLAEPEVRKSQKDKDIAYTKVQLLQKHAVYDSATKKEVPGEKDAEVVINLKRHAGLWRAMDALKPLTNKSFVIGNLGKVKTKQGKFCWDYRIKQFPT
jgi:hypothetical protein